MPRFCVRVARCAAVQALRAALPRPLLVPFMTAVPAAMTLPLQQVLCAFDGVTAIVIGPGLGVSPVTQRLVLAILRAATVPLVLDAGALHVLAPLRKILPGSAVKILLPHPVEAARLLGTDVATAAARSRGRGAGAFRTQRCRRSAEGARHARHVRQAAVFLIAPATLAWQPAGLAMCSLACAVPCSRRG
ncbi:MAG: hypothetical protein EXS02_03300 [Planctomycetes bacterium]|nr:hypothetical protein [Planctomycetota bacterium]